jgi:hypothetical protein
MPNRRFPPPWSNEKKGSARDRAIITDFAVQQ